MESNHSTAIAEAEPSSVAKNTSVTDFAYRRLGEMNGKVQVEQPQEQEVLEPEEPQEPEEVPEVEGDESPEAEEISQSDQDVLSQLDLDEMSEEELRELGQKLGSKAVARFGELTAKRKAAEEQLARLQESLKNQDKDPLSKPTEVKNNPYASIDNIEGLQAKAEEVNSVVEWAEDLLFNADGYGPDDVITEVEGKELTKADVRRSLQNARKSRDKFLPAQLQTIQSKQHGKQLREAFSQKATEELPWMTGEDNDTRKQYEAMVNDPRFKQLEESLPPDISSQLPYIIAHAANSLYGRKPVQEKPKTTRIDPPKQPNSYGAKPERGEPKSAKALKETKQRFSKTGDKNDFITLRTLQMQNR